MSRIVTKFSEFANEPTLRFDLKFLDNYESFSKRGDFVKLQDLFTVVTDNQCDLKGDTELKYNEITNVDNFGDCDPITIDLSVESENPDIRRLTKKVQGGDCISADEGDILVSSVRPNLKKFVFIDDQNKNQGFTKAFIHLRNKTNLNSELLYGFIRSFFITKQFNAVSRMGKGYPVLKEQDLRYVYFSNVIFDKKLAPVIKEMSAKRGKAKNLRGKIKNVQSIINEIFSTHFSFDKRKFETTLSKTCYPVPLSQISINQDLRFSPKFHNPKYNFVEDFLKSQKTKKLRELLQIPSSLGISPDYDDNGEAYYLSMSSIKSGEIDFENSRRVKDAYYQNNKERSILKQFDILMARSGKGTIGKVAILMEDVPNIFADFTIRIRPNQKVVNPFYLFYYFQSVFFQENVERYHKGLGNMINIFPSQIERFRVIDLNKKEQDKVVAQIQDEIAKNDKNKEELQKLREEIDSIIDKVIK